MLSVLRSLYSRLKLILFKKIQVSHIDIKVIIKEEMEGGAMIVLLVHSSKNEKRKIILVNLLFKPS